ncbi:hypothetical protein chiPu_0000239 [Chiloscyllium punctatum]|uniref:Uncharacterized protein n=1 Tax=Chiloscyllium punctatum TaxID=137246 RepID=A0A401RUP1_CHIPU|nr:hypothetical protein [Chiloscyllium punctatum]
MCCYGAMSVRAGAQAHCPRYRDVSAPPRRGFQNVMELLCKDPEVDGIAPTLRLDPGTVYAMPQFPACGSGGSTGLVLATGRRLKEKKQCKGEEKVASESG